MNENKIIKTTDIELYFNGDDMFESTNAHYIVYVKVLIKQCSDGKQYYDITYRYEFVPDYTNSSRDLIDQECKMHPFYKPCYKCQRLEEIDENGVIVCKNRVTTAMVEYLCMDDITLNKETGHITAQRYRVNIMNSLGKLWD